MICLLIDHKPITVHGSGSREGRSAVLCERCGKVFEQSTQTPPARGYEAAAQEFFRGR